MDPNAALTRIRELVDAFYDLDERVHERHDGDPVIEILADLAHEVNRLDQWLSRGESLPEWWAHGAGRR
ncbi:Uncharacterised protein [Nocardia otitidiscaviarum]|uniref:Uncharacterized protein n=1 Tax=Nocardia otitidiscaviarum TaxID=1823 RepID=A0A378YTC8_9NOCA|nr:hypothetical protein [Nocardia otitidiscaviarum]SUA80426.1 Uncharacterised protein [Nocardia otitidiscaviarum]